ncbi:MAG: hypothetical protein ABGX23_02230 [Nautiliaceae bacterium]
MERNKKFFGESQNPKRDFTPKRVIIKNRFAKIYPKNDYVVIVDEEELVIGYRYIKEFYISVYNSLPLRFLYKLAKIKRVFLIDERGYIVGEVNARVYSGV